MLIRSSALMLADRLPPTAAAFAQTPPLAAAQNPRPNSSRSPTPADRSPRDLRPRSASLLTHPRCMNCHPAGEHPPAGRRPSRAQARGMAQRHRQFRPRPCGGMPHRTQTCPCMRPRLTRAFPAIPRWGVGAAVDGLGRARGIGGHLPTAERHRTQRPARDLALLQEHIAKDDLGGHGAGPPAPAAKQRPARRKPPGQLVQAWIDSGAECPQ